MSTQTDTDTEMPRWLTRDAVDLSSQALPLFARLLNLAEVQTRRLADLMMETDDATVAEAIRNAPVASLTGRDAEVVRCFYAAVADATLEARAATRARMKRDALVAAQRAEAERRRAEEAERLAEEQRHGEWARLTRESEEADKIRWAAYEKARAALERDKVEFTAWKKKQSTTATA